jgi:hypothetical protein
LLSISEDSKKKDQVRAVEEASLVPQICSEHVAKRGLKEDSVEEATKVLVRKELCANAFVDRT